MIYACIMGNDREYVEKIVDKLSHMGYHKNTIWSTRKTDTTEVLSENSFESSVESGKLIQLDEIDNIKCGILKPIGYKQYISEVTPNQYNEICKVYKNQVIGIYIIRKECDSDFVLDDVTRGYLDDNHGVIIICNTSTDSSSITAEILRYIKNIHCK